MLQYNTTWNIAKTITERKKLTYQYDALLNNNKLTAKEFDICMKVWIEKNERLERRENEVEIQESKHPVLTNSEWQLWSNLISNSVPIIGWVLILVSVYTAKTN
ncbi:hypothetical protein N9901_01155 [Flavobacteriaceae bacterium]|nr:hypothetical protein [Flavobacteriaceae bacterium]